MRLLLDEHLSPVLVRWLAELGVYALSVPHAGLGGATDDAVWRWAAAHDMAVATTNARDYLQLAGFDIHPGLIVLRESGLSRQNSGSGWSRWCASSLPPESRIFC